MGAYHKDVPVFRLECRVLSCCRDEYLTRILADPYPSSHRAAYQPPEAPSDMPSKRTRSPPSLSREIYTDEPLEDDPRDNSRSSTSTDNRPRLAQHTPATAPTNTDPLPSRPPSPEPPSLAIRSHSSSASSSFYLIEPHSTNSFKNPLSLLAAAMTRTQQWVNDRLRLNPPSQQSYQTIPNQIIDPESYRPVSPRLRALRDDDQYSVAGSVASSEAEIKRLHDEHGKLSLFEYAIFVFLGIAM